ncbi:hypothetical protein T4D_11564 [Trichinella pseudospiralis]|uniref:Uncharacterized protein n=1 Tax=Trichinella pseudospiralis TaxID=6337 RepID=A0A0V1FNP7_TRIPS|nr:hypothetical protein T4D_11564 [Trichinella pseudospiralis]
MKIKSTDAATERLVGHLNGEIGIVDQWPSSQREAGLVLAAQGADVRVAEHGAVPVSAGSALVMVRKQAAAGTDRPGRLVNAGIRSRLGSGGRAGAELLPVALDQRRTIVRAEVVADHRVDRVEQQIATTTASSGPQALFVLFQKQAVWQIGTDQNFVTVQRASEFLCASAHSTLGRCCIKFK